MPRKVILATTLAGFVAATGATALAQSVASPSTGTPSATAQASDDDTVVDQSKKKKKRQSAKKAGSPRGSTHGSHSGE